MGEGGTSAWLLLQACVEVALRGHGESLVLGGRVELGLLRCRGDTEHNPGDRVRVHDSVDKRARRDDE